MNTLAHVIKQTVFYILYRSIFKENWLIVDIQANEPVNKEIQP